MTAQFYRAGWVMSIWQVQLTSHITAAYHAVAELLAGGNALADFVTALRSTEKLVAQGIERAPAISGTRPAVRTLYFMKPPAFFSFARVRPPADHL